MTDHWKDFKTVLFFIVLIFMFGNTAHSVYTKYDYQVAVTNFRWACTQWQEEKEATRAANTLTHFASAQLEKATKEKEVIERELAVLQADNEFMVTRLKEDHPEIYWTIRNAYEKKLTPEFRDTTPWNLLLPLIR